MISEAVGLGRRPGARPSSRQRIVDLLMRSFVWMIHRRWIPLSVRQSAMIAAFRLRPIMGASIGNTFENDLLLLIFNATAIADIAEDDTTSPLTNLQVSLHTSDPGEAGDQTTNEIAYTSYARVAVARSGSGWTVTNNSVSPAANIDFPAGAGGSGTATHFAVGTASSSTGKILFSGTVTPNIVTGDGVTPRLTTSTAITLD